MLPPPVALPLPLPEKLSIIQAHFLDAEVSTGASKTNDQNQGIEAAKDKEAVKGGPQLEDKGKGKGKEVQPLTKTKYSKDALMIKDVVYKAKDAESNSKADDTKSKTTDPKEDPPRAKAQLHDLFTSSFRIFLFFLCCGSSPLFIMYPHFDQ